MNAITLPRLFLAALAAGGLTACQPATPTPQVLADCFWSTQVYAWVDTDGDGTPAAAEPPLAGVAVNFSLTFYSGAITGADGLASVSGMYPSACDPSLDNRVVAIAPAGYTATTDLSVPYHADQERYEFGFQPAP